MTAWWKNKQKPNIQTKKINQPSRRKRGRQQRGFIDVVKEEMRKFGMTEGDEWVVERQMIYWGDP